MKVRVNPVCNYALKAQKLIRYRELKPMPLDVFGHLKTDIYRRVLAAVACQAHNLKVAGSIPASAPKFY